mmetsp:Transcript_66350/g.117321  ORF Transcript_66350/g.117321 Transcript_66350/m.117321 type:complete len:287 (-) Transcript_66350:138-998(-)
MVVCRDVCVSSNNVHFMVVEAAWRLCQKSRNVTGSFVTAARSLWTACLRIGATGASVTSAMARRHVSETFRDMLRTEEGLVRSQMLDRLASATESAAVISGARGPIGRTGMLAAKLAAEVPSDGDVDTFTCLTARVVSLSLLTCLQAQKAKMADTQHCRSSQHQRSGLNLFSEGLTPRKAQVAIGRGCSRSHQQHQQHRGLEAQQQPRGLSRLQQLGLSRLLHLQLALHGQSSGMRWGNMRPCTRGPRISNRIRHKSCFLLLWPASVAWRFCSSLAEPGLPAAFLW